MKRHWEQYSISTVAFGMATGMGAKCLRLNGGVGGSRCLAAAAESCYKPKLCVDRADVCTMRVARLLYVLLGIWLGGSLILGSVVAYNFAGLEDLLERNPKLAERAGFAIGDEAGKKESVLWVHASELNRVLFENWNRAQIVLGALAAGLAFRVRGGRLASVLLVSAVILVAFTHLFVEPQIVELGRQLDFAPRSPTPPELPTFRRSHGTYFVLELVRVLLVVAATVRLILGPGPSIRGRGASRL